MSFVNLLLDSLSSEDVIDLYFIISDLKEINLTDAERCSASANDALANARAQGIYTKGGHAFDAKGNDLGPAGKLVI